MIRSNKISGGHGQGTDSSVQLQIVQWMRVGGDEMQIDAMWEFPRGGGGGGRTLPQPVQTVVEFSEGWGGGGCFSFGGTVQCIEESNIYLCFVVCRLKRGLVT